MCLSNSRLVMIINDFQQNIQFFCFWHYEINSLYAVRHILHRLHVFIDIFEKDDIPFNSFMMFLTRSIYTDHYRIQSVM